MSAQSRRSRSATVWFATALLLFVAGSLVAWWQPPRLFPLKPQTTAEWWLQPLEDNAFRRMPRIDGSLNDVFVVPTTGEVWAVGDNGLIVHSRDGGGTWEQATIAGKAGKQPDLRRIVFTEDGQRGWAVGDIGTILASTDGGKTWNRQTSPSQEHLYDVAFAADGLRGWAVGVNGTILASADGGKTWNPQTSPSKEHLFGVAFTADGSHGWAVGEKGTILASADDGKTWNRQTSPRQESLYAVAFAADGSHGWAVGRSRTILASIDGGKTWNPQTSPGPENLYGVAFAADGLRGWAVGNNGGTILASADGGKTWSPQISTSKETFFGVAFVADGSHGWSVGINGAILSSADGGKNWNPQTSSSQGELSDVAFAAYGSRGWVVGDNGTILASADGGKTWNPQASPSQENLYGVAFAADGSRGWAVGGKGTILASADGGKTWNTQTSANQETLYDVAFTADGSRGWAVGWNNDTIIITDNSGKTWQAQAIHTVQHGIFTQALLDRLRKSNNYKFRVDIAFAADGLHGWAVGRNGIILATDNGGKTWQAQDGGIYEYLSGIAYAADGSYGWAVGDNGAILAYDNGGKTWQAKASGTYEDLYGVAFAADSSHGWVVGNNGTILASTNGGKTWNAQISGCKEYLNSVAFAADAQHGLAVGDKLTILTTSNAGQTWSPVEYHRYPAPWYFLVCLLSLTLAAIGTRRPQPQTLSASVADVLASDRPLENTADDALGYADIAAGLSRFLRNPKTLPPLTLAITGEWGSGKSSLMNLLKADLKKAGFRTVWFNAWHHQKGEQLLASLFANLRAQAIPSWFSRAGWSFRWTLLTRRSRRHALLLAVLLLLLSISLGYLAVDFEHCRQIFAASDWAKLNKDSLAALSPLLGGLAVVLTGLVALVNAVKGFGLDPAKLMASVSAGGSKLKPLEPGARYQFAEEFADVTEALAPGRLVIFIDDLDRCSKENVLEVLESVNFLVSSGGCFVVLGMARGWVETCVGLNFKELAEEHNHGDDDKAYRVEFARKYLQKLINIEVPVPKLDAGAASRLLPDKQDLPEPDNRLEAMAAAVWGWRPVVLIALLLAGGWGIGRWLAPQIGSELDWVGSKLHDSAEKPKPVELPLPVGLDLKLAGQEGGLVLGLANLQQTVPAQTPSPQPSPTGRGSVTGDSDLGLSTSKPLNPQWLLRADAAELDKGVVLGKLGGAELVLKRPATVEPEPVKPAVVEPAKAVEPERKTAENTGPSFTPGASEDGRSARHIGPPMLTGLVLLGFGLVLLLRSPVKLTEDSDIFMKALKTWHPLIAASCPTPRMVKRYLNWVRFLAMRYRPAEVEPVGILGHLGRRLGWAAKPAETAAETDKVFDEDILVALSAIYQHQRELVLDFKKFRAIRENRLVPLLMSEMPESDEKEKLVSALIEPLIIPLASLRPEDWQRAADQRERFIKAIGDVDVA